MSARSSSRIGGGQAGSLLEVERARVAALYARTRAMTEELAAPLSPEDQQIQSMPDASPVKWHRAHTTWFFEAFVLEPEGVPVFDPRYAFLFNSYYEAVGPRHARPKRGLLSRPSADEVAAYRRAVDERVARLIATADAAGLARILPILELGVAHEEQHQELVLTDALHALSENPLAPTYLADASGAEPGEATSPPRFVPFEGGLHEIGAPLKARFAFDNERPRHKAWVEPFELSDRLVTVHDLVAFVRAGGYSTPSLWLSEGFDFVRAQAIVAPLYASLDDGAPTSFTLRGRRALRPDAPVAHLSYYEADALARFLGGRLPTETEWEVAAASAPVTGNFMEDRLLFAAPPAPARAPGVSQLFGDVWEWTSSGYDPYPGYAPPAGALGEYNGKFMVSQKVLRGGSCFTPRRHMRPSYRNFWHPATRFQMTGVRIARDA
jgi:ergothioneine biosynthesis protein EgtB